MAKLKQPLYQPPLQVPQQPPQAPGGAAGGSLFGQPLFGGQTQQAPRVPTPPLSQSAPQPAARPPQAPPQPIAPPPQPMPQGPGVYDPENPIPIPEPPPGTPGPPPLPPPPQGPNPEGGENWYNPDDPQGSISQFFRQHPPAFQTLLGLRTELARFGIRLERPNQMGNISKIILPSGEIIRVLGGPDGGAQQWTWVPQGNLEGPPQQEGGGFEVDDAFSKLMMEYLEGLIRNGGQANPEFNRYLQNYLMQRLGSNGMQGREESIRETIDRARKGQLENLGGQLDDRGLTSVSGIPQGAEASALGRTEQDLAGQYSTLLRDALRDEAQSGNDLFSQGVQLNQSGNSALAQALGLGQGQQQMMANIAMRMLENNMSWNRFLAEHGLNRERLQWEMDNGNMELFIRTMEAYIAAAGAAAGGAV